MMERILTVYFNFNLKNVNSLRNDKNLMIWNVVKPIHPSKIKSDENIGCKITKTDRETVKI